MKDTYQFQAEINQLLSLIINTFYSDNEIAVRELIANASDALDKYRFGRDVGGDYDIRLCVDKEHNTLTIEDNGLGMTKSDLVNNLGIIAKSGTKAFIEKLKDSKKVSMIGQFGVGFYSSFLIANKVTVFTKHDDDVEYEWESDASGSFTIATVETPTLTRGTKICLHLKENSEFVNTDKIKEVINKHANFITYPIKLQIERWIEAEKEICQEELGNDESSIKKDVESDIAKLDKTDVVIEDITSEEQEDVKIAPEKVLTKEWEIQNNTNPIWIRRSEDITDEEYGEFYKKISNDWDTYLYKSHFHIEGGVDIRGVLYIPKRPTSFDKNNKRRIKLYVKRVFICDLDAEFIPEWMQFVTGIVDSDDLPINISREMLQKSNTLTMIKKNICKKIYDMIETGLTDDDIPPETKAEFWSQYSKHIKLGIHENDKFKEKLVKLLRFNSTTHNFTSFDEYKSRATDEQKEIYYLVGENEKKLKESPFIESLMADNKEVILLCEPIDEYLMQSMQDYGGMKLTSCAKTNSNFNVNNQEEFVKLIEKIKIILANDIENVLVSTRLGKSPCCVVSGQFGWTANMQRIVNAQALGDSTMNGFMQPKKTLEINPSNPIIRKLNEHVLSELFNENVFNSTVAILYNTALVSSGFTIDDPHHFADIMYNILETIPLNCTNLDSALPSCISTGESPDAYDSSDDVCSDKATCNENSDSTCPE